MEGGGVAHIVGVRREGGPQDGDALVAKDALATEPLIALAAWVVLGIVFFVPRKPAVDEMPEERLEQVILEGWEGELACQPDRREPMQPVATVAAVPRIARSAR